MLIIQIMDHWTKERGKDVKPQIKYYRTFSFKTMIFLIIALIAFYGYYLSNFNKDTSNSSYAIETKIYKDTYGNEIEYPMITNLSNASLQENINYLLFNRATYYVDQSQNNNLEVEYRVKCSNNTLSITYEGYSYYSGAPHPQNYFYTININMDSGIEIPISDILVPNTDFLLQAVEHSLIKPKEDEYTEQIKSYLSDNIVSKSFNFTETSKPNENINFYLTNTLLGIRFSLPYSLGSYAIIEVPLAS